MPDIPPCPYFTRKMGCPRSDPIVVDENDAKRDAYSFYCRTCKHGYVFTKPICKDRAAYDNKINNLRAKQEAERARERRRFFDLCPTPQK